MNKRIVKALAFLLLFALLLSFVSCGREETEEYSLTGKWEANASYDGEKTVIVYEFYEDGTGRYSMEGFYADRFTYEEDTDARKLQITVGSSEKTIDYRLKKDSLELEIDGQDVIFYRADSES